MRSVLCFRIPFALWLACATLATLIPCPVGAAWVPLGNPICIAAGEQTSGNLAPDGSGGAFVVWLDGRRGFPNTDLYGTRVLADGSIALGWPPNGLALAATGLVTLPSLAPDGAGGLMVFWFDQSTYQARMQHVDGLGVLAPGFPADGKILPISVGGPSGYIVRALSDDAGGAYFLWNNFNGTADAFYLTRLTGSGDFAAGWNASGVHQGSANPFNPSMGFTNVALATDPTGGAVVASTFLVENEPSGTTGHGRVRRTPASGTGGYSSSLFPPNVGTPVSIASDSAGGLFVAWAAESATGRRMQHYLADGTAAWANPTAAPVSNAMMRDGAGGIYLLGQPPGIDRLELHRRDSAGNVAAPFIPGGVVVSATGSYSAFAGQRSGNQVYVSWSHGPNGAHDLRAVAITPDGAVAPGWQAGGTVVCDAPGDQVLTALMPLAPDVAMVAWSDLRAGNSDIYVTLLATGGPVTLDAPEGGGSRRTSLAFAARSPSPNPARGVVEFAFTLPGDGAASLEIVDVSGRVRAKLDAEPRAGLQSLFVDAAGLTAGLYWGRLRQGDGVVATRFSVVR